MECETVSVITTQHVSMHTQDMSAIYGNGEDQEIDRSDLGCELDRFYSNLAPALPKAV